jgi:putative peptidoglycan lipid II flippase
VAGGALGSAFIPTFTAYLEQARREEAWRIASGVVNAIALIMIVLAGLAALFARPIVAGVLAPNFEPEKQALAASLMRIMMLSPVIFSISGLMMGILNAHQRFLLPALAPALYNLGIIGGAIFLSPSMGIYGLAWGVVIGALLHLLVQVPGLLALKMPYRPVLDVRHPGVREVARLMGPRVLGLAIVQVNFWVNTALASGMVEGSIAALSRAWVIMLLPQGIIAQSVANAVFPTFSIHAARGERDQLRGTLGQVLRMVLFLAIPASVGLIALRVPLVRLLFERGAFTPDDTQATAWALLFFALGLVAHSLVEIVTRAFYALHDTRTPVLVGAAAMLLNVALSLTLIRVMGGAESLVRGPFAGLALANSIATTLEGIALVALIRPRVGGLEGRRLAVGMLKAGAASAGMGAALWALLPVIEGLGQYLGPLVGIAAGGAVFGVLAVLLRSEEVRLIGGLVGRRVGRAD